MLGIWDFKENNDQEVSKSMKIREMLEEQESKILAPQATLSSKSKGRLKAEEECPLRPCFQHDRDRILHSKSFRRLKHKTQVFLAPAGDHYRTRLTHTLEVAQIARTLAKSLRLNDSLAEAIALGHDIGHTPFGHAGESVLNKIVPGGFRHALQSLRVVDCLEKEGAGLNLTLEVRDGIAKHSKGCRPIFAPVKEDCQPITLEGQIVRIADSIAYINHDLDDALRAGVISYSDPPRDAIALLGSSHSKRINIMVIDIVEATLEAELNCITMSKEIMEVTESLRAFLFDKVYSQDKVYKEFVKASKILTDLYFYFLENPIQGFRDSEFAEISDASLQPRNACDFIAGMTDRYALNIYEKIFLPEPWTVV